MDKYLYIVDYWVPFPQSEYGGQINVVAQSDQQCFDLCLGLDDGYDDDHHVSNILPHIKKAIRLKVDESEDVGIVSAFGLPRGGRFGLHPAARCGPYCTNG